MCGRWRGRWGSAGSVSTGGLSSAREAAQTFTSALSSDDQVGSRGLRPCLYELEYYANDGLVQCLRQRLGALLAPQQARELLHAAKATRYVDVRQFWDGEEMVAVEVAESPMLRELSELAEELLGPWAPEHVGWWILSGEAPIIAPIRALGRDQTWPTLTLVVSAWVPADALAEYYNEIQRQPEFQEWFRIAPTTSRRRLELFQFVAKDCKFEPLPIARVARRRPLPSRRKPLPARRTPRHFKPRVPWRELNRGKCATTSSPSKCQSGRGR
jgi:hypothetical protein